VTSSKKASSGVASTGRAFTGSTPSQKLLEPGDDSGLPDGLGAWRLL
jgi:hypothetical protein